MTQKYPSRLLEKAIDQFATLPGVGRKTALRLALYLLRQPVESTRLFAAALVDLREHISYCKRCSLSRLYGSGGLCRLAEVLAAKIFTG